MFKRRKPDEMEQDIKNKSVIASMWFTQVMLVTWIVICLIKKQNCMLPAYVLMSNLAVRGISAIVYKHQVGDERWKKGVIIITAVIAVVIFLLMLSPVFFFGKGAD